MLDLNIKRFKGSLINFQKACGYEGVLLYANTKLVNTWNELMPDIIPTKKNIRKPSKANNYLSNNALISRFGKSLDCFREACDY